MIFSFQTIRDLEGLILIILKTFEEKPHYNMISFEYYKIDIRFRVQGYRCETGIVILTSRVSL